MIAKKAMNTRTYFPSSLFSSLLFIVVVLSSIVCMPAKGASETLIPLSVQKDSNLIHFARDYCSDRKVWKTIAKINNLSAPYLIHPNDVIQVPLSLLLTENVAATVANLHGEVKLRSKEDAVREVTRGDVVYSGDTLITGEESFAHLILSDNRYTRIAPNTEFHINYLFRLTDGSVKADFHLKQGRVTHKIKDKLKFNESFQTTTPVALTGVRGTEFRIKMSQGNNYVETLSGTVAVQTDEKEATVKKGEGLRVFADSTIEPPKQLPDIPDLPGLLPVYRTLPISFIAPEHKSAKYIRIRLCTDAEGTDSFLEMNVTPGAKFIIPTLQDGTYYTYVTAIDQDEFESLPNTVFPVKVRTDPAAPILSEPKNGSVTFEKNMDISWLNSDSVAQYEIQIATDKDFNTIIEEQDITDSEYTAAELSPGSYFFRVRGVAHDGFKTHFSTPVSWKVSSQPQMSDMNVEGGDTLKLQWSPMEEIGTYDLQISRSEDFSNLVLSETGLTEASYQVTRELYPGNYYIRVRGVLEGGTPSQWTPKQVLTIDTPPLGLGGVVAMLGVALLILL